MGLLAALLRSGTPWRTFWGYINGNSERLQKIIPAEQPVGWNIEQIGHLYQQREGRISVASFIVLICPKRQTKGICGFLQC